MEDESNRSLSVFEDSIDEIFFGPVTSAEKQFKKRLENNANLHKSPSIPHSNIVAASIGMIGSELRVEDNSGYNSPPKASSDEFLSPSSSVKGFLSFQDSLDLSEEAEIFNAEGDFKNENAGALSANFNKEANLKHNGNDVLYDSLEDICSLVSNLDKCSISEKQSIEDLSENIESIFMNSIDDTKNVNNRRGTRHKLRKINFDDDSLSAVDIKLYEDSLDDSNLSPYIKGLSNAAENASCDILDNNELEFFTKDSSVCFENIELQNCHISSEKRNLFKSVEVKNYDLHHFSKASLENKNEVMQTSSSSISENHRFTDSLDESKSLFNTSPKIAQKISSKDCLQNEAVINESDSHSSYYSVEEEKEHADGQQTYNRFKNISIDLSEKLSKPEKVECCDKQLSSHVKTNIQNLTEVDVSGFAGNDNLINKIHSSGDGLSSLNYDESVVTEALNSEVFQGSNLDNNPDNTLFKSDEKGFSKHNFQLEESVKDESADYIETMNKEKSVPPIKSSTECKPFSSSGISPFYVKNTPFKACKGVDNLITLSPKIRNSPASVNKNDLKEETNNAIDKVSTYKHYGISPFTVKNTPFKDAVYSDNLITLTPKITSSESEISTIKNYLKDETNNVIANFNSETDDVKCIINEITPVKLFHSGTNSPGNYDLSSPKVSHTQNKDITDKKSSTKKNSSKGIIVPQKMQDSPIYSPVKAVKHVYGVDKEKKSPSHTAMKQTPVKAIMLVHKEQISPIHSGKTQNMPRNNDLQKFHPFSESIKRSYPEKFNEKVSFESKEESLLQALDLHDMSLSFSTNDLRLQSKDSLIPLNLCLKDFGAVKNLTKLTRSESKENFPFTKRNNFQKEKFVLPPRVKNPPVKIPSRKIPIVKTVTISNKQEGMKPTPTKIPVSQPKSIPKPIVAIPNSYKLDEQLLPNKFKSPIISKTSTKPTSIKKIQDSRPLSAMRTPTPKKTCVSSETTSKLKLPTQKIKTPKKYLNIVSPISKYINDNPVPGFYTEIKPKNGPLRFPKNPPPPPQIINPYPYDLDSCRPIIPCFIKKANSSKDAAGNSEDQTQSTGSNCIFLDCDYLANDSSFMDTSLMLADGQKLFSQHTVYSSGPMIPKNVSPKGESRLPVFKNVKEK